MTESPRGTVRSQFVSHLAIWGIWELFPVAIVRGEAVVTDLPIGYTVA
jgi:hypothetical protein